MPKTTTPATTTEDSAFTTIAELGEIKPATGHTLKVREVEIAARSEKEKPRRVFDVRQWVISKKYTGFGKGVMIPADQVEELRDLCDEYLALVAERKTKKAAKKAKK